MRLGPKIWYGVAAGLTLAQIAASMLLRRGFVLAAATDIIEALVLVLLLAAFARNAIHSDGRLRSFWILQMACWAFWLTDQSWWIVYDIILRKPIPQMFLGDVILFLAGVPMLAGLLLLPNAQASKQSARLGMIDFLQLLLWWFYIYVFRVMCWKYVAVDAVKYVKNFDGLYQLQFLFLLIVVVLLLRRAEGAWRNFHGIFLIAIMFHCLSVMAEFRAANAKDYYNGCWHDVPFLASFAFFVVVAVKGRDLTLTQKIVEDKHYGTWMARLAVVAVLSLPVVIVVVMSDKNAPREIVRFRVLISAVTMFAVSALVFVKQRGLHQELTRTNQTLEEASLTDPLTKARNRRFFSATIQGDVAQTLRAYADGVNRPGRDLVFYLIDMDNFKQVNDLFGHVAGDRVLVDTALRIRSAMRDSDLLIRWGGEEFLIVSRNADRREADALALRVLQTVRTEPYVLGPADEIQRTCSIGWAAFPWMEDNAGAMGYEEVIGMADRALSQAKRAGKNQAIGMFPPRDEMSATMQFQSNAGMVSSRA